MIYDNRPLLSPPIIRFVPCSSQADCDTTAVYTKHGWCSTTDACGELLSRSTCIFEEPEGT